MEYPKTRKEAKEIGAKYYFTGVPCTNGHIALRKTKGACVECLKIEWRKDAEKRADYFTQYNKSEAGQKAKKEYYARNRGAVIARAQARSVEKVSTYKKEYKDRNPELYRELVNIRRRRFQQATPKWLTAEDKAEIRATYRLALEMSRRTGTPYVVDHILPLHGAEVCGLHVPENLTVITREENLKKSNKLVDTPIPQA